MSDYKHIGKDFTPPDVLGKVTGKAKYAEDFRADGMVFARIYTSPMAHGRVTNIDLSALDDIPGVVGVLTADDVPAVEAPNAAILTNSPAFVGDPILAVAAEDETTAEEALARIRVDIEPLPFAVDPLDSVVEGGPNAREEGNVYVRSREGSGFRTVKWTQAQVDEFRAGREPTGEFANEWTYGDLQQGFEDAEVVIEEPFVTTGYAHMSMEPRTAMAYWQNNKCYVYGSAQSQSFWMPGLASLLGVETKDVVLISENTGGGFGSKIGAYPMAALPGYFSKKLGRPVQLRITREQEYYIGSARVGFQGWIKMGFAANGRITAADVFIVEDIGANATGGDGSSAGGAISMVYDPEAMRFRGLPILTNTTPRGAQRGPGQNQIAAVMAPLMDKAADQLGIDRVDIRLVNAADSDRRIYADQGPITSAYMEDAITQGAEMFNWSEKRSQPRRSGNKVKGLGIGQGYHSAGTSGFDGLVRITPDGCNSSAHRSWQPGHVFVRLNHARGSRSAEVRLGRLRHSPRQHRSEPALGLLSGRQRFDLHTNTHELRRGHGCGRQDETNCRRNPGRRRGRLRHRWQGGLPHNESAAAIDLRRSRAARHSSWVAIFPVTFIPDDIHEITQRSVQNLAGSGLIGVAKDNLPREGTVPGLAVAFVEIELDLDTGKYDILDYVGIAECGTVVHPKGLAQQMKGGAVWGMGMAGLERHVYDPQNGLPANVGYYGCRVPTYMDVPSVTRTDAVDKPDPANPFGARGIGEPAMGCSVAALTSAISDALDGHSFGRTPISRDMIVNHVAGLDQSFKPLQTNNF